MRRSTNTYSISKIQQIVEINGELVNFEARFQVKAIPASKMFEMCVITQELLDKQKNLEFKQVKGVGGASVKNDSGVKQDYVLVLRSPEPCSVEVLLEIQEIPKQNPQVEQFTPQQNGLQQNIAPRRDTNCPLKNVSSAEESSMLKSPFVWIIVLSIGIGGYFLYKWVCKKKASSSYSPSHSPSHSSSHSSSRSHVSYKPKRKSGSHIKRLESSDTSSVISSISSLSCKSNSSQVGKNTRSDSNKLSFAPQIQLNQGLLQKMNDNL